MQQIAIHYIHKEKYKSKQDSKDGTECHHFHRKVFLSTFNLGVTLLSTHFLSCQTYGTLDDVPGTDYADDTRHGNTTDTDTLGIFLEDKFR